MTIYHRPFVDLADHAGRVEAMECRDDGVAQTRADLGRAQT